MTSTKHGFTLLELLTAIAMIVMITGAMTAAVAGAHRRAKIQKATADVKSITQAILGYENYAKDHELPLMTDREADKSSIGFLLGSGGTSEYKSDIPVLLMASLSSGGQMLDPWGKPYTVTIKNKKSVKIGSQQTARTNYVLPNFYRLSKEERR